MRTLGKTLAEHYEGFSIAKFKEIKITDFEDFLDGEDLNEAKSICSVCKRGSCHFNAAMVVFHNPFKNWDVTFCEGLYGKFSIVHCWNKMVNKKDGRTFYVDFTIGAGEALLLNEWDNKDIIDLFDSTENAFVPFAEFQLWMENKKAVKILSKYFKLPEKPFNFVFQ